MNQLYDPTQQTIFRATNRYPTSDKEAKLMGLTGKKNEEIRAMTIAAFRVAQNTTQIDTSLMQDDLLLFLMGNSDTAIKYWIKEGRLEKGEGGYYLTEAGKGECEKSLTGRTRGYNTSENKVQEWVRRMLSGDLVATETFKSDSLKQAGEANAIKVKSLPIETTDERTLQQILTRRGQSVFRSKLLAAYNSACAVSGCMDEAVLEAAHITPHSDAENYRTTNGLLLRADIHTLFDLRLISVDPRTGLIAVSSRLSSTYQSFRGQRLRVPENPADQPDTLSILRHYEVWQAQEAM